MKINMKDNWIKILFLGVMMFVTAVWGHWSQGKTDLVKNKSEQVLAANLEEAIKNDSQILDSVNSSDFKINSEVSGDKAMLGPMNNKAVLGFYRVKEVVWPEVLASGAAILDFKGSLPYFELSGSKRWPLASITKLVTAVVVFEKMDLTKEVTVVPEDFIFLTEGSNRLKVGEKYKIEDLLALMLSVSSNEAAEVLARSFGRDNFVTAMNDLALRWGFQDTYFKDPTGISVSNQSTARDIHKLVKQTFFNYPQIFQLTRKSKISIKEINSGKILKYDNNNQFAGRGDFLGGKTGYTEEASGNLVSIFSYGGEPVMIVVLGTEDRFGETLKLWEWFKSNYQY